MRFIESHIQFDGGDDGHWAHNLKAARQVLKSEKDIQQFAAKQSPNQIANLYCLASEQLVRYRQPDEYHRSTAAAIF